MTSKTLKLHFTYTMEGHHPTGTVDSQFYKELPDVQYSYVDPSSRQPVVPRPFEDQILTVLGSAVLSSTVLATAIKAWLETRRSRIEVSVDGTKKTITFEGPNLKKAVPEIKRLVDTLTDDGAVQLRVYAQKTKMSG